MPAIFDYLDGKRNQTYIPDTNKNVKNCRYHLIGDFCATVIGNHYFDPWILKNSDVAK